MIDINEIAQRTVSILLVEDDNGDARAVERAFRQQRLSNPIVRVVDGVEALEVLRETHHSLTISQSRVLLLDLNMPRMNGFELLQELRNDSELHREIVFILTTSTADEDVFAAYDFNVAGYITKQRAGEDFLNLVSMMEFYWRIIEFPVKKGI